MTLQDLKALIEAKVDSAFVEAMEAYAEGCSKYRNTLQQLSQ